MAKAFLLSYRFHLMSNRAEIVDKNFIEFVRQDRFPKARSHTSLEEATLSPEELTDLFESQVLSRHLDLRARILKNDNQCYYTIGSSGHEGNAAVGKAFRTTDVAFLHYRSCALMIQRSKQLPGTTPIYDLMLSFVASSDDPISGGRHKVFGSLPLNVPPQTSTIASHLPKAVGAAISIGKAKDCKLDSEWPLDSVVLCSFGDASANHSTALGAFNTASWVAYQNLQVPLVFLCEDNNLGISVSTPGGWIETAFQNRPGIFYLPCDGLNLCDVYLRACEAVRFARSRRRPVFLHMKTVRLLGHAGSDMETSYRSVAEIEATEFDDPLLHSARILIENKILSGDAIIDLYENLRDQVERIANVAIARLKIEDPAEIRSSLTACTRPRVSPVQPGEKGLAEYWGKDFAKLKAPLHLAKLINMGLHETLLRYPSAVVFGEDVAQKGGVYNVTDGLYKRFGPRRVFNSLLDEQAILGTALGLAHNGFLPIPEIQFLAYVHNAEDQIRGEAATLPFFSQGQFTNPMILRVAGLPYQKGFGGHFHNDNSLAVFRDVPGLIIACPSNGSDAVKMLRTCSELAWEKGRVVIFVEPIALYMTRDLHQNGDKLWSFDYPWDGSQIPVGEFYTHPGDRELVIVSYGNGYYYSRQAAQILETEHGVRPTVIDLRWIAPINEKGLCEILKTAGAVLIVDECRKTGSLSEFLVAMLVEHVEKVPRTKVIAGDDCFIPLGKAAANGLPKAPEIVKGALELLGRVSK